MAINVLVFKDKKSYGCITSESVEGTVFVGQGGTIDDAIKRMQASMEEEGVDVTSLSFSYRYDIPSYFERFSFLNANEVARRAGVNPSQMRQYVCGLKRAKASTAAKINGTIKELINEMSQSFLGAE